MLGISKEKESPPNHCVTLRCVIYGLYKTDCKIVNIFLSIMLFVCIGVRYAVQLHKEVKKMSGN